MPSRAAPSAVGTWARRAPATRPASAWAPAAPDMRNFCLEIQPYSGSMMGGKDFVVQHLTWSGPIDTVICRWGHGVHAFGGPRLPPSAG